MLQIDSKYILTLMAVCVLFLLQNEQVSFRRLTVRIRWTDYSLRD